jgi:hypothetical protein
MKMKNLGKILLVAALAAISGLVGQTSARSARSQASGDDGITASPKKKGRAERQFYCRSRGWLQSHR